MTVNESRIYHYQQRMSHSHTSTLSLLLPWRILKTVLSLAAPSPSHSRLSPQIIPMASFILVHCHHSLCSPMGKFVYFIKLLSINLHFSSLARLELGFLFPVSTAHLELLQSHTRFKSFPASVVQLRFLAALAAYPLPMEYLPHPFLRLSRTTLQYTPVTRSLSI